MRLEKTTERTASADNVCGKVVNGDIRLLDGRHITGDMFVLFIDMVFDSGTILSSGICVVDGEPGYGQIDVKPGDKCWDGAIVGTDSLS